VIVTIPRPNATVGLLAGTAGLAARGPVAAPPPVPDDPVAGVRPAAPAAGALGPTDPAGLGFGAAAAAGVGGPAWVGGAVGATVSCGLGLGASAGATLGVVAVEVAAGAPAQAAVPTRSAIASNQRTP
jgi:hypothetical protein